MKPNAESADNVVAVDTAARRWTVPARLGPHPVDAAAPPCGDLWMINHSGLTVLRCRCLESSSAAMRLRVPTGYGVAVGQQYELCVVGARPWSGLGGVVSSRVTVRRIEQVADQHVDGLYIVATLDPA